MWQVLKKSCWILLGALLRSTNETDEILKFTFSTGIYFGMPSGSAPENLRYISILNFSPRGFCVYILSFTPRVDWFSNFVLSFVFSFVKKSLY